jgi:cytochrome c oxidase subunit 3
VSWATLGMIAVEATVFALAIASYFYLRSHATVWPLNGPPPDLLWGTVNTLVMIVSTVPNYLSKVAAERLDIGRARLWLCVCVLVALVFLGLRVLEFATLNTGWDENAYGSITWTLLGLHTTHLVTDTYSTIVLAVMVFAAPIQGKTFVDISENAFYWYFVVLSWLPIYAVVYWAPRLH